MYACSVRLVVNRMRNRAVDSTFDLLLFSSFPSLFGGVRKLLHHIPVDIWNNETDASTIVLQNVQIYRHSLIKIKFEEEKKTLRNICAKYKYLQVCAAQY